MASSRKNIIDRIFRSSLHSYRQEPPEGVWDGIRESLDADRRKRRMAWIGRIAATGALILAAGSVWILLHREPAREVVQSGHTEAPSGENQEKLKESPAGTGTPVDRKANAGAKKEPGPGPAGSDRRLPAASASDAVTAPTSSVTATTTSSSSLSSDRDRTEDTQQAGLTGQGSPGLGEQGPGSPLRPIRGISRVRFGNGASGTDYPLAYHSPEMTSGDEEAGIDVFEEFGEPGQAGYNKWAVGGQVSPLYSYRNLESVTGTASSKGVYNNLENGVLSYAGGVSLNYSPARRLSLQSGVYYSRMGISIANVALAQLSDMSFSSNLPPAALSVSNSTGQIKMGGKEPNTLLTVLRSKEEMADANTSPTGGSLIQDVRSGELIQQFETLEVPFVLRYRLVDRRMGLNLLGGLSSNFLIGNGVYFDENGSREYIGRTDAVRIVNYGSIVGMGLRYSVSDNLFLNLEPTFRYYLNSINVASGIGSHPYSLGIFTGIFYSF